MGAVLPFTISEVGLRVENADGEPFSVLSLWAAGDFNFTGLLGLPFNPKITIGEGEGERVDPPERVFRHDVVGGEEDAAGEREEEALVGITNDETPSGNDE